MVTWQKSPPPHDEGKFFYTGSIHFRQFQATLVFVAEKPPPPIRENFWHWIYQFQATLVFVAEKPPPPPRWGNFFFDTGSIHFRQFQATLVLWQKSSPPPMRENFLTLDLSISGIFEQLWFLWEKSPPPPPWGKNFDTGYIHFRQFWATLVFVAEKPPPLFCLLTRDLTHVTLVEYLWSPYYKSALRFLLSEYLL